MISNILRIMSHERIVRVDAKLQDLSVFKETRSRRRVFVKKKETILETQDWEGDVGEYNHIILYKYIK